MEFALISLAALDSHHHLLNIASVVVIDLGKLRFRQSTSVNKFFMDCIWRRTKLPVVLSVVWYTGLPKTSSRVSHLN